MARGKKGHTNNPNGRPVGIKNVRKPSPSDVLMERLMLCFTNGEFYVYEHYYNGKLFYVGKGKNGRAWEKTSGCRNNNWQTFVDAINYNYEIRIVCAGLSEEEALAIERVLIKSKQPQCNVVYMSDTQQMDMFSGELDN